MHDKKIIISTNKCGNKLWHENEAEGPKGAMDPQLPRFRVNLKLSLTFIGQNLKNIFHACVEEGCSASLCIIASEKKT
jgi:hypothetical protein